MTAPSGQLLVILLTAGIVWLAAAAQEPETDPPVDNLDYWMQQADDATNDEPDDAPLPPVELTHLDAVPGVIELSDGRLLAGDIYTTPGKALAVYVESERRWRRVPLPCVLSITADIVAEEMVQQGRPTEIGDDNRIYTGEQYPTRRLLWRLHLADGSEIRGAIKGQPISLTERPASDPGAQPDDPPAEPVEHGPFTLAERMRGEVGTSIEDLLYVKRVVISARVMQAVSSDQASTDQGS